MDESFDLYDDSSVGADNAGNSVSSEAESDTPVSDNGAGSGDTENSDAGVPDGASDVDSPADGAETETGTDENGSGSGSDDLTGIETDGENSGNTGSESTGNGDSGGTGMEKESGDVTEKKDGDGLENSGDGTESGADDALENGGADTEILTEINDTLHTHTENVQIFFSDTVSGNALIIMPDDNTAAFLAQSAENQLLSIDNQFEILDRLDMINGSVMLLFVVLIFDMLHRFAKRIIRNFMKGDTKNAADI